MSLEDELEPKLVEINRLACDWYASHMRYWGWEFNRYGEPAPSPAGPPLGAEPANPQMMQEEWNVFRDTLQQLLDRFRNFYGTQDVYWLHERLGGSMADVGGGGATSVHGRITLAYDPWVRKVAQLVETGDWAGNGASTFNQQFNEPFVRMAGLQLAYVRELARVARTYYEVMEQTHKVVLQIADACIGRLRDAGLGSDEATVYFLGVGSIITAIAGFWWTPAGWASLALAGAGFAMTDLPERPGTSAPAPIEVLISGSNAADAILSTHEALLVVEKELSHADETLAGALEHDLTSRDAFENPGLRIARPGVANGDKAFTEMKRQSPPGTPLSQDEVVVTIVQLYEAGKVNLSIASDQYAAAAGVLSSCVIPTQLNRFLPRSGPKFEEGRDLLGSILAETTATCADVGAALMQMAMDYELTDEKSAEVMRQLSMIEPPWEGDETPRAGGV